MVSLKTKNMRPKHMFLIVLGLFIVNGGVAMLFAKQLTTVSLTNSLVKDDSTVLSALPAEPDNTVPQDQIREVSDDRPTITTYIVKSGDTLSGIAAQFNISVNTIRWANDLTSKNAKIHTGDELVILPVTGIEYTIRKGDTISGIASRFDVSQSDILEYNDIAANTIKAGMKIVVPNAEPIVVTPKATTSPVKTEQKPAATPVSVNKLSSSNEVTTKEENQEKSSQRFINPIPGAVLTQGIHDGNAVDFGAPVGTNIYASASGTVLIAKANGYNSGYGYYIVINHEDGAQTLYAHLSSVLVSPGESVKQGDLIAKSGNTGKSTGPHLHYKEIGTGARNTFANYKKGTQF